MYFFHNIYDYSQHFEKLFLNAFVANLTEFSYYVFQKTTQKLKLLARSRSWNTMSKQTLTKTSQMGPYTRTITRKYTVKMKTEHAIT